MSEARVLGILGGMGPLATADFMTKLVLTTGADSDQTNIPTVTISFPQIPDRAAAIVGRGPSPLPAMLRCVSVLETVGVAGIVIPCNTAHCWYDSLAAHSRVPIIHIVDAVVAELGASARRGERVAILGTEATQRRRVYDSRLIRAGFQPMYPTASEQRLLTRIIAKVKGGNIPPPRVLRNLLRVLRLRGAEWIILACTELPLVADAEPRAINSTWALARACVEWSRRTPEAASGRSFAGAVTCAEPPRRPRASEALDT